MPFLAGLAALALLALHARAERLPIRVYSAEDGLPHDRIKRIVRDPKGFLWFCTPDGLSRFDGYRFTSYGPEVGLPHSSNDLLVARDGTYWIATNGQGLARLLAPSEKAPPPPANPATRPRFSVHPVGPARQTNRVNVLIEDRAGSIWAGTDGGLFRMEGSKDRVAFRKVPLYAPPDSDDAVLVLSLLEDHEGSLWIGTSAGLARRLPDGRIVRYKPPPPRRSLTVHALLEEPAGRIWVGHALGLIIVEPEPAGAFDRAGPPAVRELPGRASPRHEGTGVYAFHLGSDGRIWGATSTGLFEMDRDAFRVYGRAHGLAEELLLSLGEDRDGNLWLGSYASGAMKVARDGFVSFGESDGLRPGRVFSLFQTRGGEICVLTNLSGISRFDGERFVAVQPRLPGECADLPLGPVRARGSLRRLVDRERRGTLPLPTGRESGGTRPCSSAAAVHASGWAAFGRHPAGLRGLERRHLDLHGPPDRVGAEPMGESHGLLPDLSRAGRTARARGRDVPGRGSNGRRVDRLPRARARALPRREAHGVRAGRRGATGIDPWHPPRRLGPAVACLARGHGRGPEPHRAPGSGPPELHVRRRVGTALARPAGVRRRRRGGPCLHRDDTRRRAAGCGERRRQTLHDRRRTRPHGGAVGSAGSLRGALVRDRGRSARLRPGPDRPASPPPVAIGGLRIAGAARPVSELGQDEIPRFELVSGQNQIEIDYFGLGFSSGERLRYQFKLEGADGDWSAPTEERSVNYARLAPGRYRFLVRAITTDGVESPRPASVEFTILPPIFARWWFLAAAAVLLAFLVRALHRFRVGRLLELERVRTRIAADLHDDVGASLSQIAIMSEVLRRRVGRRTERSRVRSRRLRRGRGSRSTRSRDIVWAIDPRRDSLQQLSQRMRRFASDLLSARGIHLEFESPDADAAIPVGAETRRELYLIFKESVHNAARHSRCSRVGVRLGLRDGHLLLEVGDDGCGIDNSAEHEGLGLRSMRDRAKKLGGGLSVDTADGGGTQIRLQVPLGRRGRSARAAPHPFRW